MASLLNAQVPSDRFLASPYCFVTPQAEDVRALFIHAHQQSERDYNGDGSWGHGFVHDESSARWRALFAQPEEYVDWPTVRDTARRLAAYACALDVEPNPIYFERLEAGMEWLLKQQLPDGSFPWWVSRTGMPNTDHLFYKNGYAGVGLLEAYRHLPDARILGAVQLAADWTAVRDPSVNTNYNSLACWILVAYYRYDPQPQYLEAAIDKTILGVLPGQLPNGGWPGHNSWVYYQGIIVSGLAMLLSALPREHPRYEDIRKSLVMAINHLTLRQNEQGALLATFDSRERAEAEQSKTGKERLPDFLADPHTLLGLLWTHDLLGIMDEALLLGLMRAYGDQIRKDGPESDPGSHGTDIMALGYAWRWLTQQGERRN